ncbi:MAG: Outer rane efflux protein [Verrucomicrobiales bacterium]|nr:Outer rane efflux protein [Verrucomicrobiales bacterium]
MPRIFDCAAIRTSLAPCFSWLWRARGKESSFNGLLLSVPAVESVPGNLNSGFNRLKQGANETITRHGLSFCAGPLLSVAALVLASHISFGAQMLSLQEAHTLALQRNPRISIAQLQVLTAQEIRKEARAAYFPTLTANATAVGTSDENTRIAAGALNNPAIFDRNAEGLILSQLITDFGRTANSVAGARLRVSAAKQNERATQEELLLAVDAAYFGVLNATSIREVAKQTIETRDLTMNQVSTLASNKLRSELDVNFAKVNLDEGKLLLLRAENENASALTRLSTLLGYQEPQAFQLIEEPLPPPASSNVDQLVQIALLHRPDLERLRLEGEASKHYAKAEHAANYPTLSAVGSAGVIPAGDPTFRKDYAAAGLNLSIPLFEGGLYQARAREFDLRVNIAVQKLKEAEDNAVRDVRIAWLSTQEGFERLRVTEALLRHAAEAYDLAEERYKLGTVSIIELSQAQLNKTAAQIASVSARYEYQLQLSRLAFETGTANKRETENRLH